MHSKGNHLKKESQISTSAVLFSYLPPANEVWGKVIFLHLSVILFTGGGGAIPACIAGGIPACLAAGLQGGGIPACLAGFQAHTQGGKFRGIWLGGVSRPTPKGEVERDLVQAHSQGGSWGGSGWGGTCSRAGVCVETPVTATAAGGTHPTGMHSCLLLHWPVNKHIFC